MATGGWDATVRVWDVETGKPRWRLDGLGSVDSLAYCPSRDILAVCGKGRRIGLVSPCFRECSAEERQHLEGLLARLDDDSYAVREEASREIERMGLVVEPTLRRLTTEAKSPEVRLRCRTLRHRILTTPQAELPGRLGEVESVAITPDGSVLVGAGRDGTVRLWDVATRRVRGHFVPSETAGHFDDDSARRRRRSSRPMKVNIAGRSRLLHPESRRPTVFGCPTTPTHREARRCFGRSDEWH